MQAHSDFQCAYSLQFASLGCIAEQLRVVSASAFLFLIQLHCSYIYLDVAALQPSSVLLCKRIANRNCEFDCIAFLQFNAIGIVWHILRKLKNSVALYLDALTQYKLGKYTIGN